jgi:hypothetical protein
MCDHLACSLYIHLCPSDLLWGLWDHLPACLPACLSVYPSEGGLWYQFAVSAPPPPPFLCGPCHIKGIYYYYYWWGDTQSLGIYSSLVLRPLWPIVQTPMTDEDDCGAIGGMKIGRGNRSTRRKPTPAPLCPPQNPTQQTGLDPRTAVVGSLGLTT